MTLRGSNPLTLSAWTWAGTERAQRKVIAAAKARGLTRLNNMVNGLGSTLKRPHEFYLNAAGKSGDRFASMCWDAGLGYDETTWMTRSPAFIDDAARVLVPRLERLREIEKNLFPDAVRWSRLFVDAEDPWYEGKRSRRHKDLMPSADAAARFYGRFEPVRNHTVGSGIGYVPSSAAKLVGACGWAEPQAYPTKPSPAALFNRWDDKFPGQVESIALRSYRTTAARMRAAYLSAYSTGVREFTYWDASHLHKSRCKAHFAWVREHQLREAERGSLSLVTEGGEVSVSDDVGRVSLS